MTMKRGGGPAREEGPQVLICCADIRGLEAADARLPGRDGTAGSAFARSLLALAAREFWGLAALPPLAYAPDGRPFFPGEPGRHFSLSHTRTHVLAAVSDHPVGVDIETVAPRSERLLRLMSERERRDFEFHELWVLRESCYKLAGGGDLRSMRFAREGGRIVPPVAGALCRLYAEAEGCRAAAATFGPELPERLTLVPAEEIRS